MQKKGKEREYRVPDRDTRSAYTQGGHKGSPGRGGAGPSSSQQALRGTVRGLGGLEKKGGGDWRKVRGFGEKKGGGGLEENKGVWRKAMGFGEKARGIGEIFTHTVTRTPVQAQLPKPARRTSSQEPALRSTRGDQG